MDSREITRRVAGTTQVLVRQAMAEQERALADRDHEIAQLMSDLGRYTRGWHVLSFGIEGLLLSPDATTMAHVVGRLNVLAQKWQAGDKGDLAGFAIELVDWLRWRLRPSVPDLVESATLLEVFA